MLEPKKNCCKKLMVGMWIKKFIFTVKIPLIVPTLGGRAPPPPPPDLYIGGGGGGGGPGPPVPTPRLNVTAIV